MNKKQKEEQRRIATERYSKKVEIPICVILETIFSGDNQDVETLCRYARDYGFVDFKTGKRYGKHGSYVLQKDYEKQSFYLCLDEEERKKYDYENHLLDKTERLNNIINELEKWAMYYQDEVIKDEGQYAQDMINQSYYEGKIDGIQGIIDKLKELKGSDKE